MCRILKRNIGGKSQVALHMKVMSNSHQNTSRKIDVPHSCGPEVARRYSSRHLKRFMQGFIFFIFFYLYLWLYIDLKLIYHGAGIITNFPAFYKGWPFFLQFLSYPGGPVEYLSTFLSQLFYYSWAGALAFYHHYLFCS